MSVSYTHLDVYKRQRLDLETVGALNDKIAAGDMSHLILIQEALQDQDQVRHISFCLSLIHI